MTTATIEVAVVWPSSEKTVPEMVMPVLVIPASRVPFVGGSFTFVVCAPSVAIVSRYQRLPIILSTLAAAVEETEVR